MGTPHKSRWTQRYAGWALLLSETLGFGSVAIAQDLSGDVRTSVERAAPPPGSPQTWMRQAEIPIELAWLGDPITFPCALKAHAGSGAVEITGVVPDEEHRRRALQLARGACPMNVIDQLAIRPGSARPCAAVSRDDLSQSVASVLVQATRPGQRLDMNIDRTGQIVIRGVVPSSEDKLNLSRQLAQVPGCTAVVNLIVARSPEADGAEQPSRPVASANPIQQVAAVQAVAPGSVAAPAAEQVAQLPPKIDSAPTEPEPNAPPIGAVTAPPAVAVSASPDRFLPSFWVRADYLHWWFKDASAPPLVTTGPAFVLPTLDRPSTVVLFGNQLNGKDHPGMRFTVGGALPPRDADELPFWGVELSYFQATTRSNNFVAGSPGVPILGRPFFDVSTGAPVPVVQSVANPLGVGGLPALAGSVSVFNPSRLHGFEALAVRNIRNDGEIGWRLDALAGFRHVALNEDVRIVEDLFAQDGTGEHIFLQDRFSTRNHFYGGEVGLRPEVAFGSFFVRGTAKVALGLMHHRIDIDGYTTDVVPGVGSGSAVGGLLTQRSNIGKHDRDSFCVAQETELQVGVDMTRYLRVYAGYSILFLSQVARPADQIDLLVNTNNIPVFIGGVPQPPTFANPESPSFELRRTDFWAQGINAGLEVSW